MENLDDFFAKKDKKKKGKKKFVATSASAMAKVLEGNTEPPPPELEKTTKELVVDLPSSTATDDEWQEVIEKGQDLEGLKIRSLNEVDEVPEVPKEREDDESEEEETLEAGATSVWHTVTPTTQEEQEETIPDLPIVNNPKPTGAYVPPSMRNQPTGAGPRRGRGYGRKNNAPPDIQNKFAFPSLS